jgi:hypothetical protein
MPFLKAQNPAGSCPSGEDASYLVPFLVAWREQGADAFHLLGVSGSLREKSRTALALRLLSGLAEEHGAQTRVLDLRTPAR